MSEHTLRRVLERLQKDEEFRGRFQSDYQEALVELELTPTELIALALQDEDSLRRLAGTDIPSQGLGFFGTQFLCSLACFHIPLLTLVLDTEGSTRDTCPGSKGGCGHPTDVGFCGPDEPDF